jgi:hypothetical protein
MLIIVVLVVLMMGGGGSGGNILQMLIDLLIPKLKPQAQAWNLFIDKARKKAEAGDVEAAEALAKQAANTVAQLRDDTPAPPGILDALLKLLGGGSGGMLPIIIIVAVMLLGGGMDCDKTPDPAPTPQAVEVVD